MDTNNFKLYKIAVLIPCYNEEQTIKKVVKDYKSAFPSADIYVYDNNSTDYTRRNALEAGAIVRTCKAQGKGNVIRQMFREIEADCYIMTDGDDTYPPVPEMFSQIVDNKADMVIGDRLSSTYFQENKRLFHDCKTVLQERINSVKIGTLSYEIINESGPDHNKSYEAVAKIDDKIIGLGVGHTKKAAEQQAAFNALKSLDK